MQLNVENSEAVREIILNGNEDALKAISWSSETLGGAMNLACVEKELLSAQAVRHIFFQLLSGWDQLELFQVARKAMNHRGLWSVPTSMKAEPQKWEIVPIPLQSQVDDLVWLDLQRRFTASLKASQFGDKLSNALPGVFHEMADNALRYSGPSILKPSWGAVGYFVEPGQMTFAVTDVGRGVLASLKANPANAGLRTDQEALQAAIIDYATSEAHKQNGDGFKQVSRALADLNGRLLFRSGTSKLLLEGREDSRAITPTSGLVASAGFQLVVHCELNGIVSNFEL